MNWGFSEAGDVWDMICDRLHWQTMVTHRLFPVLGTWAAPLHEELHVLANPGIWGEGRTLLESLSWHLGQCFGLTIGLCWNVSQVDTFLEICHVSQPNCMTFIQFYFAVFGPLSTSYWGNNGNVKTLACKQGSPRGANNTRPLNHWATFRPLVIRLEKSVTFTYSYSHHITYHINNIDTNS